MGRSFWNAPSTVTSVSWEATCERPTTSPTMWLRRSNNHLCPSLLSQHSAERTTLHPAMTLLWSNFVKENCSRWRSFESTADKISGEQTCQERIRDGHTF